MKQVESFSNTYLIKNTLMRYNKIILWINRKSIWMFALPVLTSQWKAFNKIRAYLWDHRDTASGKALFFQMKRTYIFLTSPQNICCGYSLEAPLSGASNDSHNICFHWEINKKKKQFSGYASYLECCRDLDWIFVFYYRHQNCLYVISLSSCYNVFIREIRK